MWEGRADTPEHTTRIPRSFQVRAFLIKASSNEVPFSAPLNEGFSYKGALEWGRLCTGALR